jgi:hypothetical protein
MIASWGVAVAVLVSTGLSIGQDKDKAADDPAKAADELLVSRGLRRSAELYILRGEDEVRKAADAADARLKEYRLLAARESGVAREMINKASMAAELTKQRDALKKQADQVLPGLKEQIQALNQQRQLLNMQASSMPRGGGKYARYQTNPYQVQANQVAAQINVLQAQSNELTGQLAMLNNQINLLKAQPDTQAEAASQPGAGKGASASASAERPVASSLERKEAYVEALKALRKLVDPIKEQYATLAEDAEVQAALATLSQKSGRIKYVLGPSKKFQDTVKALEQGEAKVASDNLLEQPKAASTAKKKTKSAKKK